MKLASLLAVSCLAVALVPVNPAAAGCSMPCCNSGRPVSACALHRAVGRPCGARSEPVRAASLPPVVLPPPASLAEPAVVSRWSPPWSPPSGGLLPELPDPPPRA